MRYFTAVVVVIIPILLVGCAGLEPVAESDRTFGRVIEVPGATKDKIFESAKAWIAQHFRSAKAVLEYENKAEGRIIGNGIIDYPCAGMDCLGKANWKVGFTMQVDTKEQKFRLTFTNLALSMPSPTYSAFGSGPSHEIAVSQKGDLDSIRPALLKFGDQIAAAIQTAKASENW